MPYRYKESGLDDVVLPRGAYTVRKTPYGETVAIHDVEGLHRKIATKLISQPQLTGAELRFLRLEMNQTQAKLADELGTSEQTLSLWERDRNKPIPATAAKLLRFIVIDALRDLAVTAHYAGRAAGKGTSRGHLRARTPKAANKRAPVAAKKKR
jgi:putative transcriptional regulator